MERSKIEEDYAETMKKIEEFREILSDESLVLKIVKEDLIKSEISTETNAVPKSA